jgi:hypothetical protein
MDLLLTDMDKPIEYFIEKYKDYDFVIGTDWIFENTGIMLIRNCDFSRKFLEAVWPNEYNPDEFSNGRYGNYEQGSIINLIDKDYAGAKTHLKVTETQDVWNSYWYSWDWKHYALHFAACRGELLGWLINDYAQHKLDHDTEESFQKRLHWLEHKCRSDTDEKLAYERERDRRVDEVNSGSVKFPLSPESEFRPILDKNIHHLNALSVIAKTFDSSAVDPEVVFDEDDSMDFSKQLNYYSFAKNANKLCQIGFHAGHSTLIYLISNPDSHVYIFDNCEEPYAKPCLEYLQTHFPNRLHLFEYDALDQLAEFVKENKESEEKLSFDFINIDKTRRLDYTNGCYFTILPAGHYKSLLIINNKFAAHIWGGFNESSKIKEIDHYPTVNEQFIAFLYLE